MSKNWRALGAEEKRSIRFERWLSPPGIKFVSRQAEEDYKARVSRFIRVISLQKPDRVPVILPAGTFPVYYAGMTLKEAMYDNEKLCQAYRKFLRDFAADTFASPAMVPSGRLMELSESITSRWPGHGLPDDASMQQFVEDEYMKADEYEIFLRDMSDFCLRYYLPRTLGVLSPLADLAPLPHILGMPNRFLASAAIPKVREMFRRIAEYGEEMVRWQKPLLEFEHQALAAGFPAFYGGQSHAPFDILADTLRGTRGICMDMYQRPESLLEAMERLTPVNIDCGLRMADASGRPVIFFALHKGDDTFMSARQYEKFYWPTLRRVVLGLIDEGCVPLLFAEGRYNERLEIIRDLPPGKVVWHFDQTDMARAKKVLGGYACLAGNVPASLLRTGSPQAVKDYCRRLIEVCGDGGGFILTGGASIDKGNPDNFRAMLEAAYEYGVYS